jgi:hypothetical protein
MNDKSKAYQRGLEIKEALGESQRGSLDKIDQEFADITVETIFGGPAIQKYKGVLAELENN